MTCEDVLTRPAAQKDLAAISRLLGETWHATYDALLGADAVASHTATWHNVEVLSWALGRPSHAFLVAAAESGLILGTISAVWREDVVEIIRLYVHPTCQGRGLGNRLLAAASAALPPARLRRLTVEARNTRARRFYERAGFRWTGQQASDELGEALIYEAIGPDLHLVDGRPDRPNI